jgi:hypothetical protein
MHFMVVQDQEHDGGDLIYRLNSHVRRSILKGVKESATDLAACFGEMWNVILFWSIEYGNGDWTGKLRISDPFHFAQPSNTTPKAVVIVDPPLGDKIRHVDKAKFRKVTVNEGDPATDLECNIRA